ncbi:AAEL001502-PA [Aedes aegypti]|uniref:AAEL001502-PA n=1 Tax=Aedes aegypti TaxID=7159 RepID=Q17L40_AEDAE|nr:AAEL001502-PA [Aedes aegypti]
MGGSVALQSRQTERIFSLQSERLPTVSFAIPECPAGRRARLERNNPFSASHCVSPRSGKGQRDDTRDST